ncbi:MAG: protein translocase subunit SecF, partial [Clostridiales bacterium]
TTPPGQAGAPGQPGTAAATANAGPSHKESTTNYEVDKTVRYEQKAMAGLKRMTVGVVVNYRRTIDKNGKVVVKALSVDEMAKINSLVKEAMGYNQDRGDSVSVANAPFDGVDKEPEPPLEWWRDPANLPLAKEIGKYLLLFAVLAFLYFRILLPLMRPAIKKFDEATAVPPEPEPETEEEIEAEAVIAEEELEEQESQALADDLTALGEGMTVLRTGRIGPIIGSELMSNARWALLLAGVLMLAYITFRFKFNNAITAILALVHDVLVIVSVFAIFKIEVDSSFIAIILTIVGYSINNTIVIFDRIRENEKYSGSKIESRELINLSINQTLTRTINTSVAVLILLLAMLFFGGATTKMFVFGLSVGIVGGFFSSVFLVGPILNELNGRNINFFKKKTNAAKPNAAKPNASKPKVIVDKK